MRERAVLALAIVLSACKPSPTEVLVTVSATGLRIGIDVTQLHMVALDTVADFSGFEQTILLCPDSGSTSGCQPLPISVVFYPGPHMPQDPVSVLVEGLVDTNRVVLSSTAVFTFTPGVLKKLDFVLYGACLNELACSSIGQACNADGQCTSLKPTQPGGDMTSLVTTSGDLASSADQSLLPTCGLEAEPCCGAPPSASCTSGLACYNGICQACGTSGALCCSTMANLCGATLGCDSTFHCVSCGQAGAPCCSGTACTNSSACIFGVCQPQGCGAADQPCCSGLCENGLTCDDNICAALSCGASLSMCCAASPSCATDATCIDGSCRPCGAPNQQACPGSPACYSGYEPDPLAAICGLCNSQFEGCCGGDSGVCANGFVCTAEAGFPSICD